MLYILSGVAKSGKSYVAGRLLEDRRIANFSTDYLMMALGTGNPSLDIDVNGDDRDVAKALEPYLHSMISCMIQNQENYLIEGVHFNPDFMYSLLQEFPDRIRAVYLIYEEAAEEQKAEEIRKYCIEGKTCWLSDYTDKQLLELIVYLKQVSSRLKKECTDYGIPYYEVKDICEDYSNITDILMRDA